MKSAVRDPGQLWLVGVPLGQDPIPTARASRALFLVLRLAHAFTFYLVVAGARMQLPEEA
jgi:hypothetical protein